MKFEIPERKITGYLLANPNKSGFFRRFGYTAESWETLREDLLQLTRDFPLTFERADAWGSKYIVKGSLTAPDGRLINIITVWMTTTDDPRTARFLTAYPT